MEDYEDLKKENARLKTEYELLKGRKVLYFDDNGVCRETITTEVYQEHFTKLTNHVNDKLRIQVEELKIQIEKLHYINRAIIKIARYLSPTIIIFIVCILFLPGHGFLRLWGY